MTNLESKGIAAFLLYHSTLFTMGNNDVRIFFPVFFFYLLLYGLMYLLVTHGDCMETLNSLSDVETKRQTAQNQPLHNSWLDCAAVRQEL